MTKIIRTTDHADNTGSPLVVFIRWVSAYPFPPVACPPRRVIRGPLLLPIGRSGYLNRLLTETYDSHGCLSISWFRFLDRMNRMLRINFVPILLILSEVRYLYYSARCAVRYSTSYCSLVA